MTLKLPQLPPPPPALGPVNDWLALVYEWMEEMQERMTDVLEHEVEMHDIAPPGFKVNPHNRQEKERVERAKFKAKVTE